MRLRRPRDQSPEAAESGAQAWIAPPPRAALATAATKAALWGLVACGPVALLAVAANPASSDGRPVAARQQRSAAGPSGFAELYVAAYLRAGNGDTSLKAFYPGAPAISTPSGQRVASRTVTTDAREVDPGYWSVTVAADVAATNKDGDLVATGVHYFKVAVVAFGDADGGGTGPSGALAGYAATALPAEVAAPTPGTAPELAYRTQRQISSGPLADTVGQALAAYLCGAGDLSRYLSPGTVMHPITPVPYRQVELSGVTLSESLPDAGTAVPADGTEVRLLARVQVSDDAGRRWPLTYGLTMTARAGRWELLALDDAPLLNTPKPRPANPSTSQPASPSAPGGTPAPSSGTPASQTPEPDPADDPGGSPSTSPTASDKPTD